MGKNKQINSEDREFKIDGDIFKEKRKVTTFSNDPLKSESATTIIEHIRSIKGDLIWNNCFSFRTLNPQFYVPSLKVNKNVVLD